MIRRLIEEQQRLRLVEHRGTRARARELERGEPRVEAARAYLPAYVKVETPDGGIDYWDARHVAPVTVR